MARCGRKLVRFRVPKALREQLVPREHKALKVRKAPRVHRVLRVIKAR